MTSVLVTLCKRCSFRLKLVWLVSILFHLSAVNHDDAALSVIRRFGLMCCAVVWWSEMLSCSGSVMAGAVGVVLAARCWWSLPLCLWMHCLLGSHGNGKTGNNAELWNRDFQALKSYENFCRLWIYIYFLVMLSFRIEWKNGASCHTEDLSLSLAHMCVFSISGFKSTSSKPSSKFNIFLIII